MILSKKNIYLLTLALLFTGCSIHAYVPAQINKDISYQPKPMLCDSAKTANYISGAVFNGGGADVSGDYLVIGQISYSRANTFKNFDLAYGGYVFAGSIKNNSIAAGDAYYFESKSLYGFGTQVSADYIVTDDRTDFRSGIAMSFSKELGDFSAYRTLVKDQHGFASNDQTLLFSAGISNEFVMHNRKHPSFQYGGSIFFGHSFSTPTITVSDIFFYGAFNDVWVRSFARAGKFFVIAEIGAGTRLKVGYQF